MANSHGDNDVTRVAADAAREERRRLAGLYAWLFTGFFAAAFGLAVATPQTAQADSGSQTSSERGSHSTPGGASSSAKPVSAATTGPAATTTQVPAKAKAPAKPSLSDFVKNLSVTPGTTKTPVVIPPAKAPTPKTFNLGLGNVGSKNVGSGNKGDGNIGSGNLGSKNVGSGNLGSKNVGIGNNGNGNIGGGNTGSGNIGFGNTGTGNIGIGLTGDHQFGFGGLNSGTGNKGLFNSGSGNKGWFNSGSGNSGLGNSGDTNTGRFNVGDVNTGNANVGNLNTNSFNVGDSNTGSFNPGSTNSGSFNAGDLNTGWFNTGSSNTGFSNSGYLNTGIGNSGNASNGFFETLDNQNWFPGLHLEYSVPGITIDKTMPLDINKQIPVGPFTVTVGPTTVDAHVTGSTGPIKVTILDIPAGPGFLNTGTVASSGFFNTGAGGGSGLLNTGAGLVSGFFNEVLLANEGLSGYSSSGSGSGFSNLGSAVSGSRNTSSLAPAVAALVSGTANVGSLLSGTYFNQVTGTSTFNLGSGNLGFGNAGKGNQGNHNLGSGNAGDGNLGMGNIGSGNLGKGNAGDKNLGGGNFGSNNLGSGNFGDKNFGIGNNGNGNVGAGNTGNGNIGFGNTGNGNIGIGLTGDNQFGFGGLNSGIGNKGLFNSGTGNTGIFNSGIQNWGMGNSGGLNTGLFNSGSFNSGVGNTGDLNTGSNNAGVNNTGTGNPGDNNSGVANLGSANTGWANIGDTNTGWVNTGNLNTGGYNTGDGNNGLFWRRNGGGQLHIDLGADLAQIPITLNADIPINIPITAELTNPINIPSITLPAAPIPNILIDKNVQLAEGLDARVVIDAGGSLGPITFPGTSITVPQLVGTLGGPGVSIPVTLTGTVGPGRISFLRFDGPGLFNSTGTPSSGLFNSGAGGGSGFFNTGASFAASGLMNEALNPGQSGYGNKGSGSGFSNLGVDISGWSNTSSLDPSLPAIISGLRNVGTKISGIFVNAGSGKSGLLSPQAKGGWEVGINTNVDISEIPINLDGSIGVNIPLSASLTGPVTINGFSIPVIPGNILGDLKLTIPSLNIGPAVIPLTPDLAIGPINVPDINIVATEPLLAGMIGGPGTTIPIKISGAVGPNSNPAAGGAALITFKRTADPGLVVALKANVAQTPITLNADVPVGIPFNADFGDLTLQGFTIPGFNVNTTNWTTLQNDPVYTPSGNVFLDFNVPGTVLPVGGLTLNPVTVGLPTLTGLIGGPGGGFGLNFAGDVGAFTISAPIGVALDPTPVITVNDAQVSQIPFAGKLALPVGLPVSLSATPLTVSQIGIWPIVIGSNPQSGNLQGLVFQGAIKSFKNINFCLKACVALQLSPIVGIGPIAIGPIEAGFPGNRVLSLNIGGPGKGVGAEVAGSLGPIVVSLADQIVQQFPYSYEASAGIDIPIEGTTGALNLQQVDVSAPLLALLNERVGYCAVGGVKCSGMTTGQFATYVNGGLSPFPPNVPVTDSVLDDRNLGKPIGPLTLFPGMTISQLIQQAITLSGSGTLGPFSFAA